MIRESLTEARKHFGEVVDRARIGAEPTMLLDNGKEAAVVISTAAYERLQRLQAEEDRRIVTDTIAAHDAGDLTMVELTADELRRMAGLG